MIELFERLGVMQGRLSPKYNGRYQAHPVGYWEEEFPIAADLSLGYIEFIFDYNNIDDNPLMSDVGLKKISSISQKYNVNVKTVCADYFMEYPLHSQSETVREESCKVLMKLIGQCNKVGVSDIIIPCVDQSSLRNDESKNMFVEKMKYLIEKLEHLKVNLSLETDFSPNDFLELLSILDSSMVTVNYDTGNSAYLGYDIVEEFKTYGSRISDIHIKDRVFQGGSVFLGSGDVDFTSFFIESNNIGYNGPIIFQAYREDNGVESFKVQLEWFKQKYIQHIQTKRDNNNE